MKIIFRAGAMLLVTLPLLFFCSCGDVRETMPGNGPERAANQSEQFKPPAGESPAAGPVQPASEGGGSESGVNKIPAKAPDPQQVEEAEKLYDQGFQAYMEWKLDEAVQLFDRAAKLDPGCYKAYNGKGIVLCYKKNYREGMSLISKALEMKPDFVYANFNMALAYKLQKDYKQALVWFDRALSYDPRDTWSYFGIACIYAEWKEADKALEYLKKAIETDPGVKDVAKREKDLDPIRNDPRFVQLVEN
ncbi:MAG: tetratricopeptide repeat protein [Clostridiales bacterium]|jgi:tetratricopeptide (TPR) repeat protein|nr:tetratricopeptide repeat protein [Eubacteriales bacterium]MDH7567715.1 tetratricopeptide repeat protein [Clostridiales bacterium]